MLMRLLTVVLTLLLALQASAETIRVAAAISLCDAMKDIAADYEKATGDKIVFNFGSSGQLLGQINNGADVDVFISAANKQVDDLAKDKLLDVATRTIVVTNSLVLIAPTDAKDPPSSFEALSAANVKRVAIGEPQTVPAGQYAQQVLASLKLADMLKPKLVYGTNVRQVLAYVERGEVSAGVVYLTDAKEAGDQVKIVAIADPNTHEPIVYPGVVVSASKKHYAAKKFLAHLAKAEATAVFAARGFTAPTTQPANP
jgi:molybdate transport system substrate-binding protein